MRLRRVHRLFAQAVRRACLAGCHSESCGLARAAATKTRGVVTSVWGLGRVKTLLHDADRRGRTQATAIRSIWANFTATRPELILTQCRGSFTRPMNRNGARQRPYHALTAASSGFIPTMFSTRVRL